MARLEGKVAVVTGGGNGLGRACAVRFAEEGADIVLGDIQDDAMEITVAMVEAVGRRAVAVHADAASVADNEALAQSAVATFGRLDVLVTAAGVSSANYVSGDSAAITRRIYDESAIALDPAHRFAQLSLDEWHRVFEINTTGTLLAMQAAVRQMLALGRRGSIVTIASIAGKHPDAGPLPYCVSKSAVVMLTKHTARQLAGAGIRVNAIGPGFIETNMTAPLVDVPELGKRMLDGVPMGRMGVPLEIANTALFLASDESSYFTGEILHPDGGFFTE
jgi:NAD(P)-dependent dehydrogenase (short-subunit alcohol dehydrogenase family)